ncbi:MAG: CopG family transcriptional regulator [Gammaproteobacteria bacterium]|nr:MAG: CopG family transcriptional regulator [Gammaproteobacteria bacterium]
MSHLTLSISPEEQALLHRLAETNQSSDAELAAIALREYLKFEAAQIRKIQRGLAAANAGDFAGDAEVEAFFARYGGED